MDYIIKAGRLCLCRGTQQEAAATIRNPLHGMKKIVVDAAGTEYEADVKEDPGSTGYGVLRRHYELRGPGGELLLCGRPGYAGEWAPRAEGWPVSHMPRVDHLDLTVGGRHYSLRQVTPQEYRMTDGTGKEAMLLCHRGLAGGWDVRGGAGMTPAEICGVFLFCLYLDRENEFVTV